MNTKLEGCNCPFCSMPRVLSLAIEAGAFRPAIPAPKAAPKIGRPISFATFARRLSDLDRLLRNEHITEERHAKEFEALKARLE